MNATAHIYSVPLDADGTPTDKTLVERKAPPRVSAASTSAPANDQPDRFDPKAFAATLSAPETEQRITLQEIAARSAQTDTAMRPAEKPKPRFLGAKGKNVDYKLEDPIEWDGVEYHETKLGSPPGSKFDGYAAFYNEGESPQNIMMWLVSDLPMEVVRELSLEDKIEILEIGKPFLPRRMLAVKKAETEASSSSDDPSTKQPTGGPN